MRDRLIYAFLINFQGRTRWFMIIVNGKRINRKKSSHSIWIILSMSDTVNMKQLITISKNGEELLTKYKIKKRMPAIRLQVKGGEIR